MDMKNKIKKLIGKKCLNCKNKIKSGGVKSSVKIPGLVGFHEKWFCSEDHKKEWENFIKDWEKRYHKIPENSEGNCPTCMR